MNFLGSRQLQSTLPYVGVCTQVNPTKKYKYGRQFFARVLVRKSPDSDRYAVEDAEMRCMFAEYHEGKFQAEQVIAFEARKGRSDGWYTVSDKHDVKVLGSEQFRSEKKVFDCIYISLPKARDGREDSSYGQKGLDDWPLEIPLSVLQEFFQRKEGSDSFVLDDSIDAGPGLYGVLGVPADVDDLVLRKAYRRLARQLHPDVSDVPDATRRFQELDRAYKLLKDPVKRQRHDALMGQEKGSLQDTGFTAASFAGCFIPPFRCGRLEVTAQRLGTVWRATRIERWLVRRKKETLSVRLRDIMFEDWGIACFSSSLGVLGAVDVENAQLPFTSRAKWSAARKTVLRGLVTIETQLVENARWNRGTGDDLGTSAKFWQAEKILAVELDIAAKATIAKLQRL